MYLDWLKLNLLYLDWSVKCGVVGLIFGLVVGCLGGGFTAKCVKRGNLSKALFLSIVAGIASGYVIFVISDKYIANKINEWEQNKIEVNKTLIEGFNVENEFTKITEVLIDDKLCHVTPLMDTLYLRDCEDDKVILEKVTYKATKEWYISDEVINEINNTTEYYVKEVHKKGV